MNDAVGALCFKSGEWGIPAPEIHLEQTKRAAGPTWYRAFGSVSSTFGVGGDDLVVKSLVVGYVGVVGWLFCQ